MLVVAFRDAEARAAMASDLALFTRLESWEALQGYEVHPAHVKFRALVGALRTERRGFDYQAD